MACKIGSGRQSSNILGAGPGGLPRSLLLAMPESLQVIRPLGQRAALLLEILVGVIGRDNSRLRMIQAALGDVGADAELGEAGAYRSPKVMQREPRGFGRPCVSDA
jgi:hypothetical protein